MHVLYFSVNVVGFFPEKTIGTKYKILPLNDIEEIAQTENAKRVFFFAWKLTLSLTCFTENVNYSEMLH